MDDIQTYNQEYDRRQYQLMLEQILAYENKHLSLRSLTFRLEGLLEVLNDVSEEWVGVFYENWGVLELVHADMIDRNQTHLDKRHTTLISNALQELKQQIQAKLEIEDLE